MMLILLDVICSYIVCFSVPKMCFCLPFLRWYFSGIKNIQEVFFQGGIVSIDILSGRHFFSANFSFNCFFPSPTRSGKLIISSDPNCNEMY